MPRLLTRQQAAAYCGMSLPTFEATCPVIAISMGNSKRLERYDIKALDGWIDRLGAEAQPSPIERQKWLGLVEKPHVSRSRQGT